MSARNDITAAMPATLDMEKGLLSCMMQAPDWAIMKAQAIVKGDHFHMPSYGLIFRTLCEMHREGIPVEPVALMQILTDRGTLQSVGGMPGIVEIYTAAASPAAAPHYAAEIRDKATLRKIINVCSDGIAAAMEQGDALETLEAVEGRIMDIREREAIGGLTMSGKEALFATIDALEAQMESQTPDGISWGFPRMDAKTGGICPGLTIIGAEPSGGKSILAMQAVIALLRAGKRVEYYTLEMPIDLCVRRMLCNMSRMPFGRIRNPIPAFDAGEYADFQKAAKEFGEFGHLLTICADGGKTASSILSDVRSKMASTKTDAVVLDYVQLLTPEDSRAPEQQQISDASRIMKRMADQFNIPVITPVQLNDTGKVRGSRKLGMDCDCYIKIEHDRDDDGQPAKADEYGRRNCGLWVEKNRNGERWFMIDALMDGAKMNFEEKYQ